MSWRARISASIIAALLLSTISAFLPPASSPIAPHMAVASGENITSPRYVSAAVMPNGQVGLLFQNNGAEIRFKKYTSEQATAASVQISTATPAYPQLVTFRGELVAAYVDTRSPNVGKLAMRISADNGATWSTESYPLGSATFAYDTGFAPVVVASRDAQTLYVFSATSGSIPQYRTSTDATLGTWSSASAAGDSSMVAPTSNSCGNGGPECGRAHAFQFMETAVAGRWLFVSKSPSGYGQSGRGTQFGTIGGSWSSQVDLGGSGGVSGGGDGSASTFLDRNGAIYYVRSGADGYGTNVYFQKSSDNGASWGGRVYAYTTDQPSYLTGSPVGLYVPGYSQGEYVWWAGFGGSEDTVRVDSLWTTSAAYPDTATARLFGSAGGDWDAGLAWANTFGANQDGSSAGTGVFTTSATDLAFPGRLLPFAFSRTYNSADLEPGRLGKGWTDNYNWKLTENGDRVTIRRGDGRRDTFTRNADGSYSAAVPGVFDVLVKHTDKSYTLTTPGQVQYEFVGPSQDSPYASLVSANSPVAYWRLNETSGTTAADAGPNANTGSYGGGFALGIPGALRDSSTAVAFNGTNATVTGGTTNVPTGSAARTIEAWVNPTNGGTVFTENAASGQKFIVQTLLYSGTWYLFTDGVNPSNNITISGAQVPPAGIWSHVAFVFDGSANTWHYYLNGVATTSGTFATAINTATLTSTTIGDRLDYSQPFNGSIDEVAVYGSALSATQIAAHYAGLEWRGGLVSRIHEPAGNAITLSYTKAQLTSISDTVGRTITLGYASAESNIAKTKSYTESIAASGTFPDTGGTELTDGSLANPNDFHDAGWQGHLLSTPLDLTVDLGSTQSIGVARSFHYDSPSDGLYKPATVEVLTSTDNVTYTSRGSVAAASSVNDAGHRYHYDIAANASARYVRFRITSGSVWTFTSELEVYAGTAGGLLLPQGSDRLTTITDPSGRITNYGYDAQGRLTTVGDHLANTTGQTRGAHTWTYGYETIGQHILTITDPDGRVALTNTYDSSGRLATQKDGLNKQTTRTYSGNQTVITDPRSHATTLTFDTQQRMTSSATYVSGATKTASYTYDAAGNRTSATDRDGNTTDFTYDARGNLLTTKAPQVGTAARAVTTYTYDSKNNVLTVTDPLGFVTTNTYNGTTNVLTSTTAQIDGTTNAVTKLEYGDSANPGLPTKLISPRGNTTGTPNYTYSQALTYDSSGNLVQRIDADGAKTTYAYDTLGRRTSTVDPDGYATGELTTNHTWTTAFDANDRVTSSSDPLNQTASSTYDGVGHQVSATNKNGNVTTYAYDAAGRLSSVAQKPDPTGQPTLVYTTSITRDDNGNATAVTQANGVVTNSTFDELDRQLTTVTHPTTTTSLTTSYVLNGNGQPTTKTTGDGVAITYVYDTNARLTSAAATGLTTIAYTYDAANHRTQLVDATGTTTYSYDGLGRLTQAAQPNGTTTYGYDLDSDRTTLGYPTVGTVTYTYSAGGRLTGLTDWASHTAAYTYTSSGQAATVTAPGGLVTTYSYDFAHRLSQVQSVVGTTTITNHLYTLDPEGNRTALDEFVSGITTGTTDHIGYTYDGLERLTAGTTTNPESFSLDAASNISSRTGPSATNTYDASNRQTGDGTNTLTWNAADRLVSKGSDSFSYDPLDRLTGSTVSSTARTYAYNGDGLLQSRTESSVTTTLLWDPSSAPSRLLQLGADRIVYGLGPLYVVTAGGATSSFARDGGKSIRAEVNGSGAVTASFRYRAYGTVVQSSGASTPSYLGYAGQFLDPSGLYYLRARWYDALTGRFSTMDPANSGNRFGYGAANPLAYFDPTGAVAMAADDAAGGDCIEVSCSIDHQYVDYSAATSQAASGMLGMTTYLEELRIPAGRLQPSDYTAASLSVGPLSYMRSTDRFGQDFQGLGVGIGPSAMLPNASLTKGNFSTSPKSAAESQDYMRGASVTFLAGAGAAYVVNMPLGGTGPTSTESGISSFNVSVGVNYVWRVGDLARQMVGSFGMPRQYR